MLSKILAGFEGRLTTSKWATLCRCSQDTAYRDINELIHAGFLQVGPLGGSSTSSVRCSSGLLDHPSSDIFMEDACYQGLVGNPVFQGFCL